jgi:SAM-dependent methyltransferase
MNKKPSNIYEANVKIDSEQTRLREFSWPYEVSIDLIGDIIKDTLFLDIGAGSNTMLSEYIRAAGAKYIALDSNRGFLGLQARSGAETVAGDLRQLPIDDNSFDVCHARFVLAHLGKDKAKGAKEAIRVVNRPGQVIFMDYDWTSAHGSEVFNGIRGLFCEHMLFDASFGAKLEGTVRSVLPEHAQLTTKRYALPKMTDYSLVLNLRGAARVDLEIQDADKVVADQCNRLFDKLKHEADSADPPGFYFPEIVAVVVEKE